ncbi:MAG: Gfo/Idh/MocA family oxidoreductase [Phycisphaerae bacterium]
MGIIASLVETSSFSNALNHAPIKQPIKTGVVGLGHRSPPHLNKLITYEDFQLTAICDRRPALVKSIGEWIEREHGRKVRGYCDYEDMIKKEDLDALVVLIDPDKQVPLICRAMDAGCHVMAEVPLAYTLEDCWRLVATVERTGKIFLLMEQTRFWGFVRAWREIVQSGVIGRPLFVEGEYVGYYGTGFYFQDEEGHFYNADRAKNTAKAKPTWRYNYHPITYLPHELSPLLYVLDDHVDRVVGMSTQNQSYRVKEVRQADFQCALMHTAKDAVMRLAVGFTTPVIHRGGGTFHHWYHIKGTDGALEWSRAEWDKPKLWVDKWQMPEPVAMPWTTARTDGPAAAKGSGHGDADFYVFAQFADAVLRGIAPELDVYKAAQTAAPAILAARSIENHNNPVDVPDFRPGPHRKSGKLPKGIKT